MARFKYICALAIMALVGCTQPEITPEEHIVVEGWIEAGAEPIVMLHRSYDLRVEQYDTRDEDLEEIMAKHMIMFGKVEIDNGEESVVLTGRLDTNYMPPYIYTSVHMLGEEGKTYRIRVSYKDFQATAQSVILPAPHIDSIQIKTLNPKSMGVLLYMSQLPPEEAYYALFVRDIKDQQFGLSPLGTFTTQMAQNGILTKQVYQRDMEIGNAMPHYNFTPSTTQYEVKIARIDPLLFSIYDDFAAQLFSQGMFFMSEYKNIGSNIEGGLGYFGGMGSSVYPFQVEKDTTYIFTTSAQP